MPWPVTVALQDSHWHLKSWKNTTKPTPPKINESNLKMMVWKMIFLSTGLVSGSMLIFRGVESRNFWTRHPSHDHQLSPKFPDENSDGPSEGALDRAGDCSNLGLFQRCLVENSDFLVFFSWKLPSKKGGFPSKELWISWWRWLRKKGLEEENLTWSYSE